MKTIHNVIISVFAKEGEDLESIKKILLQLVGLDTERERIILEHSTAEGIESSKMDILRIRLEKERHVNNFFEDLISKFSEEQKELLTRQLDSRIDDGCYFFIRLDKTKLLNGEYQITDSGDCFHIKILVAAYPAKKERAIEIVKGLIRRKPQ